MTALPFIPVRSSLYTPAELLQGFELDDPASLETTSDFAIYRLFALESFGTQQSPFTSMMESLHDHFVNQAAIGFLGTQPLITGIMGGHDIPRDSPRYRRVAELGQLLAKRGALVVTGGGPGAMEAAHLGAAFAHASPSELDDALARLRARPALPPDLRQVVSPDGRVDPVLRDLCHAWWRPAVELYRSWGSDIGTSLALPTWYYGHEAFTPFATQIAKFFQNSVREDGLVTFCTGGVVYTPGGPGTLQEIFQDAAQNLYRRINDRISPMVFLDSQFWTDHLPAVPLLKRLFAEKDYDTAVLVTDSIEQAVDMLAGKAGSAGA